MSELTNPHDKFFKEMFSQLDLTGDFLQNYLPAPSSTSLTSVRYSWKKRVSLSPSSGNISLICCSAFPVGIVADWHSSFSSLNTRASGTVGPGCNCCATS
ncbi:MAG: Rpn family recombination-promoting nuclease/putative transposase [Anaerolineae bacterium]|nr:Rpn family recombination-promoting nuclease/putative transposase [Anaerolineae bacterium]